MNLIKVDISELTKFNPVVAKRLENVSNYAEKLGAVEGGQRLLFVGKHFSKFSVDEAYHFIAPDEIIREAEEVQARKKWIGFWQTFRNAFGIFPLIFTWFSLFW